MDGTAAGGRGRGGEGRGHRNMATDLIFPLRSDDKVKLGYMCSDCFPAIDNIAGLPIHGLAFRVGTSSQS